jgi:polo-like kinase 1
MTTAASGTSVPPKEDAQTIVEERIVKFNGDHVIKKYLKGKFLGKGGFAKCYEMTNLENKKVQAAKIIMKSSLHHNNIVGFEHFFEDAENVYILLELCTN